MNFFHEFFKLKIKIKAKEKVKEKQYTVQNSSYKNLGETRWDKTSMDRSTRKTCVSSVNEKKKLNGLSPTWKGVCSNMRGSITWSH